MDVGLFNGMGLFNGGGECLIGLGVITGCGEYRAGV